MLRPGIKVFRLSENVENLAHHGLLMEVTPKQTCRVLWPNGTVTSECLEDLINERGMNLAFLHMDFEKQLDMSQITKIKKEVAIMRAMKKFKGKDMLQKLFKKGYDEKMSKIALYWGDQGRMYKPSKAELDNNEFLCPKCKTPMNQMKYRQNQKTWGCPNCSFIIKDRSILTPENLAQEYIAKKKCKGIVASEKQAEVIPLLLNKAGDPLIKKIDTVIKSMLDQFKKDLNNSKLVEKYPKEKLIKNAEKQFKNILSSIIDKLWIDTGVK